MSTMTTAYILIGLTVLLSTMALAIGLRAVMQNRIRRRAFRTALHHAAKGEWNESLRSLLRAEALWQFSITSGSRKSIASSLAELADIVDHIDEVTEALACGVDSSKLQGTIASLTDVFSRKINFRWDERSMRPESAERFAELHACLRKQREALRLQCQSVLKDCAT